MAETASTGSVAVEVPQRPPGALIGVEVSYKEPLQLSDEEKTCLQELLRMLQQRDMASRREQIIRVWERRLFYRGDQHLLPRRGGGWQLPGQGTGYGSGEQQQRSIFETNIYNSYAQIIISALTREVPTVRFKPKESDNDADITAASSAEKLKVGIERNNCMKSVMAEMSRFLWTDGLAVLFTSYRKDGQAFGYEDQQAEEFEKETVPEDEESLGNALDKTGEPNDGQTGPGTSENGQPRGREVIEAGGALEYKFPMKAACLAECGYALRCRELDLSIARAKYPDVANKITANQGGPGGDDIDRLARVNVKLGVLENYLTSDSTAYDVTEVIGWIRPAQLLEIKVEECRNSLIDKAGRDGIRVVFCGETFCEARALSMDDQLSLIHALPGDGLNRPGLGDWLMPIQKVLNNWLELADEYFVHGVPNTWADNDIFDVAGLNEQVNLVGVTHGFDREPGVSKDEVWWQEEPIQFPQYLWEFIQFFQGDLAQLLCGAFPALSGGGDSAPTDTMGGMMIQRDQALGRVGLPWRAIKEGIAITFRQAVSCLAHNHQRPIEINMGKEAIRVEMEDLKGEFTVYPETDEHFPESYTQKQNRLSLVVQDAATNPFFQQLLDSPDNLEILKDGIGLEDMTIPMLESRDKQLGENTLLLKSGPAPNPKMGQLKQMMAQLLAQLPTINPQDAQATQQLSQQIQMVRQAMQSVPPMVSSVEIAWADDDSTELLTCKKVLNSADCRRMRNGSDDERAAYQNLELHAQEHEAALKQKQAAAGPPKNPKPPSISLNVKDLPPKEAAAATMSAGIPATPQDFQAQQEADALEKHPGQVQL